MARSFNLNANLNVGGPTNVKPVVNALKQQLGSVVVPINVKINNQAIAQITQLNNQLKHLSDVGRNSSSGLNVIGTSLSNLSAKAATNTKALKANSDALKVVGNQAKVATSEIEEFGRISALAVRRFAAFSLATNAIFGLIGAVKDGVRQFISFDREIYRLSQVTATSISGLKDLRSEITRLSTTFGVSSTELLGVSSTLAQAGLTAKETKTALEALAKSSLAPSFDDIKETTEGAIAAMRQFGIQAKDLESALGSINSVAAAFAVESQDIISAIRQTGGVFAASSKGVSEGTAALNEFISVFTSVRQTTRESAESIATGLRTIFTRVQRASTIDYLRNFGIELHDLEGKFVGPYEATRRLAEGLKSLDTRDIRFSSIIEELGGFRQIGKVIPLIQQFTVAEQALTIAQGGTNSLARDAATVQEALAVKITKVKEEFLALIRTVSESSSFKTFVGLTLDLASGLIRIGKAIEPLLPFLGALGAIKGVGALTQFGSGFFGGLKRGGGAGAVGTTVAGALTGGAVQQVSATTQNTSAVKGLTSAIVSKAGFLGGVGVRRAAMGGPMHFASGGLVPGSGTGDTVPANLTAGEYVLRKSAVKAIGRGTLDSLNGVGFANAGRVPGLKDVARAFGLNEGQLRKDRDADPTHYNSLVQQLVNQKTSSTEAANLQKQAKASSLNNLSLSSGFGGIFLDKLTGLDGDISTTYSQATHGSSGAKVAEILKPFSPVGSIHGRFSAHHLKSENEGREVFAKYIEQGIPELFDAAAKKLAPPGFEIQPKSVGLEQLVTHSGAQSIKGHFFEAFVRRATNVIEEGNKNELFDFAHPHKELANLFTGSFPANVPVDAKVNDSKENISSIIGKAIRYFPAKQIQKFASGGGVGDTIPAMLTPGEYVINKSAASRIGQGNLDRMNRTGFATGGLVPPPGVANVTGQRSGFGAFLNANTQGPSQLPQAAEVIGPQKIEFIRGLDAKIAGLVDALGHATDPRRFIQLSTRLDAARKQLEAIGPATDISSDAVTHGPNRLTRDTARSAAASRRNRGDAAAERDAQQDSLLKGSSLRRRFVDQSSHIVDLSDQPDRFNRITDDVPGSPSPSVGRRVGRAAGRVRSGIGRAFSGINTSNLQVAGFIGAGIISDATAHSTNGTTRGIGGGVSGALAGASAGAIFGPFGIAIGGAVGAIAGFTGAMKDAADELKEAKFKTSLDSLEHKFEDLSKNKNNDLSTLKGDFGSFAQSGGSTSGGLSAARGGGLGSKFSSAVSANVASFNDFFKGHGQGTTALVNELQAHQGTVARDTVGREASKTNIAQAIIQQQLDKGKTLVTNEDGQLNRTADSAGFRDVIRQLSKSGPEGAKNAEAVEAIHGGHTNGIGGFETEAVRKINLEFQQGLRVLEKMQVETAKLKALEDAHKAYEEQLSKTKEAIKNLSSIFDILNAKAGRASHESSLADSGIQHRLDTAHGSFSILNKPTDTGAFDNPLAFSSKERNARLDSLAGGLGVHGDLTGFKASVNSGSIIEKELPDLFKRVLASNPHNTDPDDTSQIDAIKKGLGQGNFAQLPNEIRDELVKTIQSKFDSKKTEGSQGDTFETFLKGGDFSELLGPIGKKAEEAASNLAKGLGEANSKYITGINQYVQSVIAINEKALDIQEKAAHDAIKVAQLQNKSLSLAEASAPTTQKVAGLTGGRTDVGSISANIGNLLKQKSSLEGQLGGGDNRDIADAIGQLDVALSENQKALEILSNDTTKLAFIEEKLSQENSRRDAGRGFIENVLTQNPLQRFQTQRENRAFNAVNRGANLSNPRDITDAFAAFKRNNALEVDPNKKEAASADFFNKISKQLQSIAPNLSENEQKAIKAAITQSGQSSPEQALIAQLKDAQKEQQEAASALNSFASEGLPVFLTALDEQFSRHTDALRTAFEQALSKINGTPATTTNTNNLNQAQVNYVTTAGGQKVNPKYLPLNKQNANNAAANPPAAPQAPAAPPVDPAIEQKAAAAKKARLKAGIGSPLELAARQAAAAAQRRKDRENSPLPSGDPGTINGEPSDSRRFKRDSNASQADSDRWHRINAEREASATRAEANGNAGAAAGARARLRGETNADAQREGRRPGLQQRNAQGGPNSGDLTRLGTAFGTFGTGVTNFTTAVQGLAKLNIPSKIEVEINAVPAVQVNVTGIDGLMTSLQAMMKEQIAAAIGKHINPLTGETKEVIG